MAVKQSSTVDFSAACFPRGFHLIPWQHTALHGFEFPQIKMRRVSVLRVALQFFVELPVGLLLLLSNLFCDRPVAFDLCHDGRRFVVQ